MQLSSRSRSTTPPGAPEVIVISREPRGTGRATPSLCRPVPDTTRHRGWGKYLYSDSESLFPEQVSGCRPPLTMTLHCGPRRGGPEGKGSLSSRRHPVRTPPLYLRDTETKRHRDFPRTVFHTERPDLGDSTLHRVQRTPWVPDNVVPSNVLREIRPFPRGPTKTSRVGVE